MGPFKNNIYVFCLSLWLSDLPYLFAFSITHLLILRNIFLKTKQTKSGKSIKIPEKKKESRARKVEQK